MRRCFFLSWLFVLFALNTWADESPGQRDNPSEKGEASWAHLDAGISLARFPVEGGMTHEFVVLRVDPKAASLKLLSAADSAHEPLAADEWARRHNLRVVINAGMFEQDHLTHTGLMKNGDQLSGQLNKLYSSFAMFDPTDLSQPAFRIFDADTEKDMEALQQSAFPRYRRALQNLRLIKRPGQNRWKPQPKAWSEAALGEDADGRALLMFCGAGLTMHDFNERILKLPIHLVAAQHLEGGPEASLYVKCGAIELRYVGSYETGFNENEDNKRFWPIPNVIAVQAAERK